MAAPGGLQNSDRTMHAFGQKTSKYVFGQTNVLGSRVTMTPKTTEQYNPLKPKTSRIGVRHKYQELLEKLEADFQAELRELCSEEVKSEIRSQIEKDYSVIARAELKAQLKSELAEVLRAELKEEMRARLEPEILAEINAERQEAKAAGDKMVQHNDGRVADSRNEEAVAKDSKSALGASRESPQLTDDTALRSGATQDIDPSELKKSHKRTRGETDCNDDGEIPKAKRPDQRHREQTVHHDNDALKSENGIKEETRAVGIDTAIQEELSEELNDGRLQDHHSGLDSGDENLRIGIRTIYEGVVEESIEHDDDDFDADLDGSDASQESDVLDSSTENPGSPMENGGSTIETAGSSVESTDDPAKKANGSSTQNVVGSSKENAIDLEESDSDETVELPPHTRTMRFSIAEDDLVSSYSNRVEARTYSGWHGSSARGYVNNSAPSMVQAIYDDLPDYESNSGVYDDIPDYESETDAIQNGSVGFQGNSALNHARPQNWRQVQRWEDDGEYDEYEEENTLVEDNTLQGKGESDYDYLMRLARQEEEGAHEYDNEEEDEEDEEL